MSKKEYKYIRKTFTFNGVRYEARGATEAEAIENRAVMKETLKRGEATTRSSLLVKDWVKTYLATYQKPRINKTGIKQKGSITQKSYQMYEDKLNGYIVPAIGTRKLKDVTPLQIQAIFNEQAGKSFSHVSKLSIATKALFRKARELGYIVKDPTEPLVLPATKKGERRSLTPQEIKWFLKACEGHPHGVWAKLMYYTGLRPSETPPLTAANFDIKKKTLTVTNGIESGTDEIAAPKTKAGVRTIPIEDVFWPELSAYLVKHPTGYLFTGTRSNARVTVNSLSNWWNSIYRAMNIAAGAKVNKFGLVETNPVADDLVLDDLRHTYCTNLQKKNVPINKAKYLMGHSSIAVTANIYTHTTEADIADIAALINKKPTRLKIKRGKLRGKNSA